MMRRLFYEACTAPSWLVSVEQAGHFQFLDKQSSMQRAICAQGRLPDYSVRQLSQVCAHTHHPYFCEQFANKLLEMGQLMCDNNIFRDAC